MSRYKIYQIDHFDPKLIGLRKRRLRVLYAVMFFVFFFTLQLSVVFLRVNMFLLFILYVILISSFYLYFHFKIKSEQKLIKTIGEIEFTRTIIRKRIADSVTEYDYRLIESIELERHIPSDTVKESKTGYFSYIIKIIFTDSRTEMLVISDKPVNSKYDISIVETMKTLKKIVHPEISIIT
jgi:Ca2+/Na+ antiporter